VEELRAQFPVLERFAYLNAGTNGPVPRRAFEAAEAALREQLEQGRSSKAWFERQIQLGATQADVALTGSTTDGVNAVLHAIDLGRGNEILTSDEEHPGVLGPIATARDTRGVSVRVVPFDELPGEIRPETRIVVTSHVSWATGRVMDTAPLAASGALVLLDGAQGLGAVPVDVRGYHAMEWSEQALVPALQPDARRLSTGYPAPHHVEWSHASLDVFEEAGFGEVHERAANLAERFAEMLLERDIQIASRALSTLVSFEVPDPEAFAQRAADEGIVIRHLPGRPWARASVGAWNTENELERLAELASRR
jgi:L-cysteine/cystine lyase